MSNTLLDPDGIGGDNYAELEDKIQTAKLLIGRSPDKGGFPFVFVFSATKNHILKEIKLPIHVDEDGNEEYYYTAATDGTNYYWSPQLIEALTPKELCVVMAHETYHVVLDHCNPARTGMKNRKIWNIAVDYVVNGMIEHDMRQASHSMHYQDNYRGKEHPIWKGELGAPLYFDELINSIKAQTKAIREERKQAKKLAKQNGGQQPATGQPAPVVTPPASPKVAPTLKKKNPSAKELGLKFYADYSLYGKSSEEIYDEIMKHFEDLTNEEIDQFLESQGISLDDHPDISKNRQQLLQEVLEAKNAVKKMGIGTIPAAIEEQLLKLSEPKLSWQDLVRTTLQKKRQEKGSVNDWSRFKRRAISMEMYRPKKKDDFVRWCAFLDTSGSMSQEDLNYAISQLKCLDGRSEGIVIPNDAQPYWDKATNIRRLTDLQTTKIVGRGGTIFEEIFRDFRKKTSGQFDVLIILTDGGIFDADRLKNPGIDVVWVLTNNYEFHPPFGRVAKFRP